MYVGLGRHLDLRVQNSKAAEKRRAELEDSDYVCGMVDHIPKHPGSAQVVFGDEACYPSET